MGKMLFKLVAIFLIIGVFITSAELIFVPKNGHYNKSNQIFYNDNREVVDVGLFGGSHAYNAFCPSVIYENNGIKAFNYSVSGQPITLTYYVMKEAIATQNLKVAVVDLYYLGQTSEYFKQEYYIRNTIDYMKFSRNKLDAIFANIQPNNRISYILNFVSYHSRWNDLTESDFNHKVNDSSYYKLGWGNETNVYGSDFPKNIRHEDKAKIPEKTLDYLNRIIELAKEHNIKLVFTALPHDYEKEGKPDAWVEDEYGMYNTVREIAKKNGIEFIQFLDILDEIGFVPREDMYNAGHMNVRGAKEVSTYLGNLISKNYSDVLDTSRNEKFDNYLLEYKKTYAENEQIVFKNIK